MTLDASLRHSCPERSFQAALRSLELADHNVGESLSHARDHRGPEPAIPRPPDMSARFEVSLLAIAGGMSFSRRGSARDLPLSAALARCHRARRCGRPPDLPTSERVRPVVRRQRLSDRRDSSAPGLGIGGLADQRLGLRSSGAGRRRVRAVGERGLETERSGHHQARPGDYRRCRLRNPPIT